MRMTEGGTVPARMEAASRHLRPFSSTAAVDDAAEHGGRQAFGHVAVGDVKLAFLEVADAGLRP